MGASTTALDRLEALIANPDFVSDEQRKAIEADGNYLLIACPGSGKTRTAGLRAAWLALSRGWKVAATSYTNVAVAEIRAASALAGVVLTGDHFAGTLHSLLLRFVFYPFGHLVMGCEGQATLVADPADCPVAVDQIWLGDNTRWGNVWMFNYRADSSFSVQKPQTLRMDADNIVAIGSAKAAQLKQQLFKAGYASYSDSMFIAMQVLEHHGDIAELVASRFDEIIVDEAQDTSDVQLRCLDVLKQTKRLRSLVMAGDPDQAIYEWQGSDPTACTRFAEKHAMEPLHLTKNFRSSQAICDVACRLLGRPNADDASGHHRDFGITPEILLYTEANASGALGRFSARLEELGIPPAVAPILARTQTFVEKLNRLRNVEATWAVKALGAAAARFQRDGFLEPESLGRVEAVIRRLAWGSAVIEDASTRIRLRDAATKVVRALPSVAENVDLKNWIAKARSTVQGVVTSLTTDPVGKPGNVIKSKKGDEKKSVAKVFESGDRPGTARTVHSAKGESHPAVLLAAARASRDRDNAREWIRAEIGEITSEETRIGYVAMTRAQRYCAVALPANTMKEVIDAYIAAGFVMRDS